MLIPAALAHRGLVCALLTGLVFGSIPHPSCNFGPRKCQECEKRTTGPIKELTLCSTNERRTLACGLFSRTPCDDQITHDVFYCHKCDHWALFPERSCSGVPPHGWLKPYYYSDKKMERFKETLPEA
ncbi:hypothetical protein PGT21_015941 [Puccinia graminis f. sp. tritici]|uniref:Secreted protein n=1 Tax=Puccinia graminis f. sp. tritici TaxID=56615 RepID=A0A5B0NNG7_PUCGR|nr:hypothetical protein PGTUg99_022309 [Puccinia graminis f. sp. tritici]KAA1090861.1 hypothetical protein PGT21_015941 [Puccinia graminis f. sp. tritici]